MWRNRGGFTLLEMVVVIAVLATLAGMLTPLALGLLERHERELTEERLEAVYQAVVGCWGENDYGFLGDIGRLPAGGSLDELLVQGALPAYALGANGVGLGWKGPYVETLGEDYKRDAWGRLFSYSSATGQVTSLGPDGVVSADDITYPAAAPLLTGGLQVSVLEEDSGTYVPVTANTTVAVYYASGGAQSSVQTTTYPYVVTGLHPGMHAVFARDAVSLKQGWTNAHSTTGVKSVQVIIR